MNYTIYKVTNKTNGKIYIGSHKTLNLNDGYMGSGTYLNRAMKKHGIDNFVKEILFVFDTPELMYAKEAELVDEEFLTEANTYNLKVGGFGGWDYVNSEKYKNPTHSTEHMNKMCKARTAKYPMGTRSNKKATLETRARMSKARLLLDIKPFLGKKHTEETKQLMSKSAKITSKGKLNSQYGTRWIHSLEIKKSIKISKDEQLPIGWSEGRKIKW